MSGFNDYQYEKSSRIEPGDYRVEIIAAEETTSKTSGKQMIVVTVKPNAGDVKIKHYTVTGEYFNRNMSALFDSFGIEPGNFLFPTWIGAIGAARLKEDDQGYLKVAYFLSPKKAESLPSWDGEVPERQSVTTIAPEKPDDDELPF